MINEWLCVDENEWHEGVSQRVAQLLRSAIAERGQALLAVSGGRSPIGMFQRLRTRDLDWSKVIITLADERWVPGDHADSNAALVRKYLLQGPAAQAQFLPLYNDAATPHEGRADCDAALRALPLPFDCVVLGMGEDGHTASFFPDAEELACALALDTAALCWPVTPPKAPHLRMTLTQHALLHESRQLLLAIEGKTKRQIYERARTEPSLTYPVSQLLHQDECPIDVWIEE